MKELVFPIKPKDPRVLKFELKVKKSPLMLFLDAFKAKKVG